MDDIELIKSKINIVDLIQEYLPLKKAGINFKANCPFHQEKSPSFMVSPERQIWHCFGCFPPGELVKTPFGFHKIEEINKNHWVVSGKGNLKRVTETMIHQYKGSLVEVSLRKLGGQVRLTADHNVFVVRGAPYLHTQYKNFSKRYKKFIKCFSEPLKYYQLLDKYLPLKKISAGQLTEGDLLLYPINRREVDIDVINLRDYLTKSTNLGPVPREVSFDIAVNEDFLKLIGYWIAEGSSHRAYIRFSLGNHEEDFALEIVALIKKIFTLDAKIHRRKTSKKTGIEITACHSKLANIFENLCGKGAENKHIPFVFQELPVKKQLILLNAIHKGDGTTFIPHRSRNRHKSITTISRVLEEQLVDILLRSHIFPTLYVENPHVDKLLVNHRKAYSIFWSEEAKQKYTDIYYQPDGSEYWLLPIKKLTKEKYEGPVYNFSVADDHSYIATNFAVANCQKGGDIYKFVMEKEGLEFKDALEVLAQKAGVVLKKTGKPKDNTIDRLYEANQKAAQFYNYLLTENKVGKKALDYLLKRGLTPETIKEFSIGYAPQNWETLVKFLRKRGFNQQELTDSGLIVPSSQGGYDRFRGRIMFPLKDARGRVCAFSGRVLGDELPKYINTPQTKLFDKSRFLLGLNLTKSVIKEKNEAIIVEGEMDFLMSYQSGVKNIIASKGTALTQAQVEELKKYAQTILLCFDTDLAGDVAARRGIEIADKAGLNIKVIDFEGVKDPAELIKSDPKLWEKAAEEAIPIYDYYLKSVALRFNPKQAIGKREALNELLPIWSKISDSITREHYIEKLSAFLTVKDDFVREELQKYEKSTGPQGYRKLSFVNSSKPVPSGQVENLKPGIKITFDRREMLEQYLIAMLLHQPSDVTFIPNFPETLFTQEELKQVYVLLVLFLDSISFKSEEFRIGEFIKTLPPEFVELTDRLYLLEIDAKLGDKFTWQKELDLVVSELKKMLIKTSLEKLSLQIKNAQEFGKDDSLETLNHRFRDLSVKLKNL